MVVTGHEQGDFVILIDGDDPRSEDALAGAFGVLLAELVEEFGIEMVRTGLTRVEGAWELVKRLQETFALQTPITHAPGYEGFSDPNPFFEALENLFWKREMGLPWSVYSCGS